MQCFLCLSCSSSFFFHLGSFNDPWLPRIEDFKLRKTTRRTWHRPIMSCPRTSRAKPRPRSSSSAWIGDRSAHGTRAHGHTGNPWAHGHTDTQPNHGHTGNRPASGHLGTGTQSIHGHTGTGIKETQVT